MKYCSAILFTLFAYINATNDSLAQTTSDDAKVLAKTDPKIELGKRFLAAIVANDEDKYVECWLGFQEMEAALKKLPASAPKPNADQLKKMKDYIAKRDDLIRVSYAVLRRGLKNEFGDIEKLKVSNVIASNVSIRQGRKVASSIDVVLLTPDKRKITYRVDDGASMDDRWYFSDRPAPMLTVELPSGKTENILLGDHATKDELKKLSKLTR